MARTVASKAEGHLVEWKESWRDERLRWVCGFANAEGGTLVIGKNDKGEPVGVPDAKRLLVDLRNKILYALGLVVPVRAITQKGKTLVEIEVEASPTPISYRGEYHFRSGSTRAGPILRGLRRDHPRRPPIACRPGESEMLECASSTAELRRAGETLCAFLNDKVLGVHSIGGFPAGICAELLSQEHRSISRNPLIAGAFHCTGAVEVWGGGTNRIIEACCAYGSADPTYYEPSGAATVTFKAEVVAEALSRDQVGTNLGLGRHQVQALELAGEPRTIPQLMAPSGRTNGTTFWDQVLAPLFDAGLVETPVPASPEPEAAAPHDGHRARGNREREERTGEEGMSIRHHNPACSHRPIYACRHGSVNSGYRQMSRSIRKWGNEDDNKVARLLAAESAHL